MLSDQPSYFGGAMSPEQVVCAQLNAWATLDAEKILSYFSDEAVLVDPTGTYRGLGEVRSWVQGHVKRMDHADLEVLNVAVNNSLVMVERVDRFIYDGKNVSARCMGAFEVAGDKIIAWRDYFDMPY
jgi:limonene-1,2-epoxide hydrolase